MKFRTISPLLMVPLILFIVIPLWQNDDGQPTSASASTSTTTSTKTQNGNPNTGTSVVWLVLDEAPLYALLQTDGNINAQRFPGFSKLAASSTWYRDTLATAQRTTEAVPAMLDGKWPTLRNYPVLADHPVNLFTLANGHKALDVYQSITNLCPPQVCANKIPDEERQAEFQISAFEQLIKNSSESTDATVHFSHIQLPHRPWRFATDGRLGRELETDPRPGTQLDRRRDTYQALLRQFVATDALLLKLLTTLEQSQNWDRTMLIVTSDHGLTFVPGESIRDNVNPSKPETLEDIYRIPLFIKYPNQQSAQVNDCPVSSIDILSTVLAVSNIPHNAELDGVNLSTTCPNRTSRKVQWPYTGKDLSTNFSDLMARVRYYDRWVDADGNVDDIHRVGLSGSLLGTQLPPEVVRQQSEMKWTNIDAASFAGIGDTPYSYVPARVSGRVTSTTTVCSRCEGILVVDGTVVASIPELAGMGPSVKPTYFTTSLMTSQISSTSSPPELWIADWTTPEVAFSFIGNSS